jgi:hypothetical protein
MPCYPISLHDLSVGIRHIQKLHDVSSFLIMVLTGFLAQMVDGSMGMGYGTISTTFLLANGVSPQSSAAVFTLPAFFPAVSPDSAITGLKYQQEII